MSSTLLKFILLSVYLGCSFPIFNKIYNTTQMVIDEEFHLRQGLHYCNKQFSEWDEKITTFPGLYIASCIVIPLNLCNVYGLRLVSLAASAVNVIMIFLIRERGKSSNTVTVAMESITIAILPPMYFFSHLYYTDVLSITLFLCLYYFWNKNSHTTAAVFGGLSVLVRQTNIVWVVMLFGTSYLNELIDMYAHRKGLKRKSHLSYFNMKIVRDILLSWGLILQSIVNALKLFYGYIIVIVIFVSFVTVNGSIAVGDKNAHEATLHIPQLFYYGLFTLVFGAPVLIKNVKENFTSILKSYRSMIYNSLLCAIIVRLNTLVHPYLLADNRHYTFYIWNRLYGKYEWFKYAMAPIYAACFRLMKPSFSNLTSSFQIMFWISTFVALCAQKLLDVRYFLIPFLIWRLNITAGSRNQMILEFVYNVTINAVTIYMFMSKEIQWANYTEPQRLIW